MMASACLISSRDFSLLSAKNRCITGDSSLDGRSFFRIAISENRDLYNTTDFDVAADAPFVRVFPVRD
jgi:hypothetical protein